VDNFAIWQRTHKAPPCPECGATCTTYNSSRQIHCNQCSANDGIPLPKPVGSCCGNFLPQMVSGSIRCGNCGFQTNGPVVAGMTRAQHAERNSMDSNQPNLRQIRRWIKSTRPGNGVYQETSLGIISIAWLWSGLAWPSARCPSVPLKTANFSPILILHARPKTQ
jgi:hypothetical protein